MLTYDRILTVPKMEDSTVTVDVDIFIVINISKYINFLWIGGFIMNVSITTDWITGLKSEKFYCCRNGYQGLINFTETLRNH